MAAAPPFCSCAASSSSGRYAAPSDGPSKAASRLIFQLRHSRAPLTASIRRAILHTSQPVLLSTLRHLIQEEHDWQLALPMYLSLADAPWFRWSSDIHADLVALLTMSNQIAHAKSLLERIIERLDGKQLVGFDQALIQHYARYGCKDEMVATYKSLRSISPPDVSLSALLQGYGSMDLSSEALSVLHDMQQQGLRPSSKDYKTVIFSLGKCGMFEEMETLASDMESSKLMYDPVVFNMILTTYATVENHEKVRHWMKKMAEAGLKLSVRSLNAVSKACSVLSQMLGNNTLVKKDDLLKYLESQDATRGEIETVSELLELCPTEEVVMWEHVWQLDVHSTVSGSAYAMLCCWLEDVRKRLTTKQAASPSEIAIVTGWGKHSEVRGNSSMKEMIRDLFESAKSPFKVDSQNKGRMVARPHAVLAWISQV